MAQDLLPTPELQNQDILSRIPKINGRWFDLPEDQRDLAIAYLQNPCIVELCYVDKETGEMFGNGVRMALGLRTNWENMEEIGIGSKGIDFDVMGRFTLDQILAGVKSGLPGESDEKIRYIGRLEDINNSDKPAVRQEIFAWEIDYYFKNEG